MRLLPKLVADEIVFAASDLHIGSPLTRREIVEAVKRGIAHSDIGIHPGDIWEGMARFLPLRERLAACKEAVNHWAEESGRHRFPKPQFFLPGNHEIPTLPNGAVHVEAADLLAALQEHCRQYPHIFLHDEHWLQHGDAVFTHGNKELGWVDYEAGPIRQWADRAIERFTPGLPTELARPRERTVRLIHRELAKEQFQGPVNHVVFGHRHTPFTRFTVSPPVLLGGETVQFHNPGVAYKPRNLFYPLFLDYSGGSVIRVRQSNLGQLMSSSINGMGR